jgi:hypothetical protein
VKKWPNELNRVFQGRSPNGQKTHEEMLNIPGHKGNANENTLRFHLTPVRMVTSKTTNVGEDVRKNKPFCTTTMENSMEVP